MSKQGDRFGLALVGNRRYPRYAIVLDAGCMAPVLYWTGRTEGLWSPDRRTATRWADPEIGAAVLAELRLDADHDPSIGDS